MVPSRERMSRGKQEKDGQSKRAGSGGEGRKGEQ